MSTITNTIRNTWDSFLGKVTLCVVCAGWAPYVLLSMAVERLAS